MTPNTSDEVTETGELPEVAAPVVAPFAETDASKYLTAVVTSINEIALNEYAKAQTKGTGAAKPFLLAREIVPINEGALGTVPSEEAMIVVHMNPTYPTPLPAHVTGPQIGPPMPSMPGVFYTTPTADAKYGNGYVLADGTGQRFKYTAIETQNKTGLATVRFWIRTTCPVS